MLDVSELLPHQGTARLLTQILRYDADSIEAVAVIPPDHPLASSAGAPNFLALELGAQAAAVLEALLRRDGAGHSQPRRGYLVRAREGAFRTAVLPLAAPLSIRATCEGTAPPLAMYKITIFEGDKPLASALLSTYSEG
jgi:predicted hotdog family 3-hydroxylacyl-ACP dehydratase